MPPPLYWGAYRNRKINKKIKSEMKARNIIYPPPPSPRIRIFKISGFENPFFCLSLFWMRLATTFKNEATRNSSINKAYIQTQDFSHSTFYVKFSLMGKIKKSSIKKTKTIFRIVQNSFIKILLELKYVKYLYLFLFHVG